MSSLSLFRSLLGRVIFFFNCILGGIDDFFGGIDDLFCGVNDFVCGISTGSGGLGLRKSGDS
jgi:hypothetical protein